MSKIVRLVVAKGKSEPVNPKDPSSPWLKRRYELEIEFPGGTTEDTVHETRLRTEMLIDGWFEQPETPQISEFNPEELMKHEWKGRKTGDGQYAKGSVSWGWDFKDQFSEDTIRALEKTSPLLIDDFEFTLGGTIVQAKKKKK